jgi:SAM-dependent methyltransferase
MKVSAGKHSTPAKASPRANPARETSVTFGGQEFEEMARLSCSTAKKGSMKKTTNGTRDHRPYALGYSASELRRLERQGAFFRDLTADLLKRVGVRDGMRVLDLGCGVGDTSLLAARLIGPSGVVVGVDRSAKAIDVARRRATTGRPRYSVQFVVADLGTFVPDEPFDAIIGRLILLYLRDPAAMLRRLSAYVRPGGVAAFQEMAMPLARSNPELGLDPGRVRPRRGSSLTWAERSWPRVCQSRK